MINYIRHDEEFYFIVKLVSGEQIIGKGFAVEENNTTQIFVSDPVEITVITRSMGEGKGAKGVAMNKWMEFSSFPFGSCITITFLRGEVKYPSPIRLQVSCDSVVGRSRNYFLIGHLENTNSVLNFLYHLFILPLMERLKIFLWFFRESDSSRR